MVLYQSCRAGKRVHSGVPCKLNNEKHEQTPWTILIKKNKVVLETCQIFEMQEQPTKILE